MRLLTYIWRRLQQLVIETTRPAHHPRHASVPKDHSITRHRTLVERTELKPRSGVPPYFTPTSNTEVQDYSHDTGGLWFTCRCGKHFETARAAHDHLQNTSRPPPGNPAT